MSSLHALRYRLRALLRAGDFAREQDDELRFHLELEAMHQRHAGVGAEEAPYAANRRLGNTTLLREEIREMSARHGLEVLAQDLTYGLRSLRRAPGFTLVATLTLALGIGATTAIFSVVNAVLLRPLPYRDAERVVMVWMDNTPQAIHEDIHSYPNFADLRAQGTVFAKLAAYNRTGYNVTGGCAEGACEPQRITAAVSTADLFDVLGVRPALGRAYEAAEEEQGRDGVVVISHGLWTRMFGADPRAVGRTLRMNGRERIVVGVMPRGFAFPSAGTDLWVPMALSPQMREARQSFGFYVVGRLAPGISMARASTDVRTVWSRLQGQYPEAIADFGINLVALPEQVVGRSLRTALWVMLGAVAAVLLIGCANVANLLLSRAAAREREVSVRLALGASRARLVRQLLTESVLLAGIGGALGVVLAWGGLRALTRLAPADIPRLDQVHVDGVVLAVTTLVVVVTGVLFGLAPALHASRPSLSDALREGGRGGTAGRRGNRMRQLLAAAQVALVVVLLTGAGLLIRSFLEVQRVQLGFRPDHLLTMRVALPGAKYQRDAQRVAFFNDLVERVRVMPGVRGAAATSSIFLSQTPRSTIFTIEGRTPVPDERNLELPLDAVTPDYFRVMGVSLLRGRAFTAQDRDSAPPVVIVNANMARRFWPNDGALGKRFKYGGPESRAPWMTIVGVVADMRRTGFDAPVRYETFLPLAQTGDAGMTLVVRTARDALALAAAVRGQVRALDPDQPVYEVKTMDQLLSTMVAQRRFSMTLLGTFAALALVLGVVGVYGVTSYLVAQRTREVGLRLALGADPRQLVRMVVGQGMRVAAAGMALGLLGALVVARLMVGLLYGVTPVDAVTLIAVTALLALATLVANYLPARRAARVDPLVALRAE
ncbi:MAG: ABC transporter permease [Gemmatimonadaceae bacterium]